VDYRGIWMPGNMSPGPWHDFKSLRDSALNTARAWAIKEFGWSQ
jgi:hypothetical protein